MEKLNFNCVRIFAAAQFKPFIEKVLSERDSTEGLSDFNIAMDNISGMYEFKYSKQGSKNSKKSKLDPFQKAFTSPNFVKLNQDRVEINQQIENSSEEDIFKQFQLFYDIHNKLYNNNTTKFGIIKIYDTNQNISYVDNLIKISSEYANNINDFKFHLLIKREGYNINIDPKIQNNKLFFKIDINNIINRKNYLKWDDFEKLLKVHKNIIEKEINKIFGE